jgi:hypothetical protein
MAQKHDNKSAQLWRQWGRYIIPVESLPTIMAKKAITKKRWSQILSEYYAEYYVDS